MPPAEVVCSNCNYLAREALEEALEISGSVPLVHLEGVILYQLGEFHLEQDEKNRAGVRLDEALQAFRQLGAKKHIIETEETLAGIKLR